MKRIPFKILALIILIPLGILLVTGLVIETTATIVINLIVSSPGIVTWAQKELKK